MQLLEFFKSEGGDGRPRCSILVRMAVRIGVSPRTLYMVARGHKLAGPRLCSRIERYTESKVRRADLRPDIFLRDPAVPEEARNMVDIDQVLAMMGAGATLQELCDWLEELKR